MGAICSKMTFISRKLPAFKLYTAGIFLSVIGPAARDAKYDPQLAELLLIDFFENNAQNRRRCETVGLTHQ